MSRLFKFTLYLKLLFILQLKIPEKHLL